MAIVITHFPSHSIHQNRASVYTPPPSSHTTSNLSSITSTPSPIVIKHGLSGFGPRKSLLVVYTAAVLLAHRDVLAQRLIMSFNIFEMQSASDAGAGNSFQTMCDASLNTGLPERASVPGLEKLGERFPAITDMMDVAGYVKERLDRDMSEHMEELKRVNPTAFAMFNAALGEDGKLDTVTKAFTTRGTIGKIQHEKLVAALAFIDKNVPEIKLHFWFEHQVVDIEFKNARKPCLIVQKGTCRTSHEFDYVHLANGTTWESPVSGGGPLLLQKSFSGIPNFASLGDFLSQHSLLDGRGHIKRCARVGVTGMSLSAYDFIPLLLNHTPLLLRTSTGYDIDISAAKSYQGLITFISRSEGQAAPPRHVHSEHWHGSSKPIFTTEDAHAMFLQTSFDWLSFWKVFLDANIARSLGKVPADFHSPRMSTRERMIEYARQTERHFEACTVEEKAQTESGLLRSGYWAVLHGGGFEVDPATAEKKLVEKAPLTRSDRAGFLMRRGTVSEVTQAEYVVKQGQSNKAFFDEYAVLQSTVAASPPQIHYLIARMFELGVARHVQGMFSEIGMAEDGSGEIELGRKDRVDVLLAPKVLTRRSDQVLAALQGRVKEVVPGQPCYTKGRFLQTLSGEIVHAIDVGVGGHGVLVDDAQGHQSVVGMRWTDTNTRAAASDWATTAAPMMVLLSAIAATQVDLAPSRSPVEIMMEEYRKNQAPPSAYAREVAQFAPIWHELRCKHAFLLLCKDWAGSDAYAYRTFTDHVFTPESRQQIVDQHGAREEHLEKIKSIPAFRPLSRDAFAERFVDFTPGEMQGCWDGLLSRLCASCT